MDISLILIFRILSAPRRSCISKAPHTGGRPCLSALVYLHTVPSLFSSTPKSSNRGVARAILTKALQTLVCGESFEARGVLWRDIPGGLSLTSCGHPLVVKALHGE